MDRNEAIEIVRKNWPYGRYQLSEALETLIPELKESEDEKIRKYLLSMFPDPNDSWDGIFARDIIAWLEKQENNPYSGVSFKYNDHVWGMCARDNGVDILLDRKLVSHVKPSLNISSERSKKEDNAAIWLINDIIRNADKINKTVYTEKVKNKLFSWFESFKALPFIQWTGDNLKEVIEFTGKSPRFDEWFNSWEEYEQYVHSHYDILKLFNDDGSHYEVPVGAWIVKTPDGYNMSSRGKLIEKQDKQKPVDMNNVPIQRMIANYSNTEEYDEDGNLKGKPLLCMIRAYEQGIRDIINFVKQPNLNEWSEEDEKMLEDCIGAVAAADYYPFEDKQKMEKWLKSLKDRVQPHPKQEWSDEDYNEIETIACHLDNIDNEGMAEALRNIRDKYYGIIPQNTWKPSKEQMEIIEMVLTDEAMDDNVHSILKSLYSDLQKLM